MSSLSRIASIASITNTTIAMNTLFAEQFTKYAAAPLPSTGNFEKKTFNTMGRGVASVGKKVVNALPKGSAKGRVWSSTAKGIGEMAGGGALGTAFGAMSAAGAVNKIRGLAGAASVTPRRLV